MKQLQIAYEFLYKLVLPFGVNFKEKSFNEAPDLKWFVLVSQTLWEHKVALEAKRKSIQQILKFVRVVVNVHYETVF